MYGISDGVLDYHYNIFNDYTHAIIHTRLFFGDGDVTWTWFERTWLWFEFPRYTPLTVHARYVLSIS